MRPSVDKLKKYRMMATCGVEGSREFAVPIRGSASATCRVKLADIQLERDHATGASPDSTRKVQPMKACTKGGVSYSTEC